MYCRDKNTDPTQCKWFELGESIIRRFYCIANITGTIDEDGTVNNEKFQNTYSGTVFKGHLESTRDEYEKCTTAAQTFYTNSEEMVSAWMTGRKDA